MKRVIIPREFRDAFKDKGYGTFLSMAVSGEEAGDILRYEWRRPTERSGLIVFRGQVDGKIQTWYDGHFGGRINLASLGGNAIALGQNDMDFVAYALLEHELREIYRFPRRGHHTADLVVQKDEQGCPENNLLLKLERSPGEEYLAQVDIQPVTTASAAYLGPKEMNRHSLEEHLRLILHRE